MDHRLFIMNLYANILVYVFLTDCNFCSSCLISPDIILCALLVLKHQLTN